MLKPRTRLISLRMTEEEYEAIRQASAKGGARCVSEFARNALLESAQPTRGGEVPQRNVATSLELRLMRVEQQLAQIVDELHAHLNGAGHPAE